MSAWNRYIRDHLPPLDLRPEREEEIVEELAQHLEAAYEDALAQGDSEETALAKAKAIIADWRLLECEIAGAEQARPVRWENEDGQSSKRKIRGGVPMRSILQDLRYGLRMMARNRVVTAAAVLSLALGIGANTAIFSLINAVLLRSLPVENPEQLVLVTFSANGNASESFPYPTYEQFRDQAGGLMGLVASSGSGRMRMSGNAVGAQVESVQVERVSGNFFSTLDAHAARGRTLSPEDDLAGNPQPVAVLSYGFWERRFGLDPGIVGKQITLMEVPITIIGVASPGFSGFEVGRNPDLWLPLQMTSQLYPGNQALTERNSWWLRLMGRLEPGATRAQAQAKLDIVFQQILMEAADSRAARLGANFTANARHNFLNRHIELQSGRTGWTRLRKTFQRPLMILMIVVGLVLAIACANVANLLVARAATRRKEIAMRLALGAGRWRLIRQLLTESLLLATISGVFGIVIARWGAQALMTFAPQSAGFELQVNSDPRVLAFTLALTILTGLLFGLAPALRAARLNLVSMLKDPDGNSMEGRSRLSLNQILIVTQIALSLMLLVGAGLFVRSLQKLKGLDLGFDRENVMTFSLEQGAGYDRERRIRFYQQVLDRLQTTPGTLSASLSGYGLLSDNNWSDNIAAAGYVSRTDENLECYGQLISPKYFETMRIPILTGRDFNPQDARTAGSEGSVPSPRVAIVNQTMAQYFFPNQNPIGKRFSINPQKDLIEIVGLVKDTKYRSLQEQTRRTFYLPFFQMLPNTETIFELRTAGDPEGAGDLIRRIIRDLDPNVQITRMQTMNDAVDGTLVRERFLAKLAGFFSLFALLLSAIGLYGVMSYAVSRRTKEIGVRMALGAREADVQRMILRETLSLVAVGAAVGVVGALTLSHLVSSLLFGVAPNDPVTIAGAILLLAGVAALAGYLPARQASRVDPMTCLRYE